MPEKPRYYVDLQAFDSKVTTICETDHRAEAVSTAQLLYRHILAEADWCQNDDRSARYLRWQGPRPHPGLPVTEPVLAVYDRAQDETVGRAEEPVPKLVYHIGFTLVA